MVEFAAKAQKRRCSMKFEALRRLVVRYFGPRATSVSPDLKLIPPGVPYLGPHEKPPIGVNMTVTWGSYGGHGGGGPTSWSAGGAGRIGEDPLAASMERAREKLAPFKAQHSEDRPGIEPPGNYMPWDQWRALAAGLDAPPGWSACRFPTWRPGDNGGEVCAFVFGIVRRDFGIWQQAMEVCRTDVDGQVVGRANEVLSMVTHLPSGLGMGVFADRASALISCDAHDSTGVDWRAVSPADRVSWGNVYAKLIPALAFVGIAVCDDRHAHDAAGRDFTVWQQRAERVFAGKPEKAS